MQHIKKNLDFIVIAVLVIIFCVQLVQLDQKRAEEAALRERLAELTTYSVRVEDDHANH